MPIYEDPIEKEYLKLKQIQFSKTLINSLLDLNTNYLIRTSGFPKGATLVDVKSKRDTVCFIYYHPDFEPIVNEGCEPPSIDITSTAWNVCDECQKKIKEND